jgi:D-alanyl-D-alanine carboxypeptidase/D-alanyl-D-alanine-endopeptidase (penicillin-binding protein 4)
LSLLKDALKKRGIKVDGQIRLRDALDQSFKPVDYSRYPEVAAIESKPISEIVTQTLKISQNLYAQLLLLQVAAHASSTNQFTSDQTSEDQGLAAMTDFLDHAGISRAEIALEEGSGLSRGALVTPNSLVQLLVFMSHHRDAETFRNALPIAGVDGSLRNRLKLTAAAGNARAKTGSLNHVATLSGYVTTAAQEHLAFSIMLNNYFAPGSDHSAREEIDAIVALLAELREKSPARK